MDRNRRPKVPHQVLALAQRLGAVERLGPAEVRLTQTGMMRNAPAGHFMRFRAEQTLSASCTEFEWRARTGPFGCITVIDAFRQGKAELQVLALGRLRVAGAEDSPAARKGEIMRYLAELAWAPDGILGNPELSWDAVDNETLRVSCRRDEISAAVEFGLNSEGRIGSVYAPDRPRREGDNFIERPWRGLFREYRQQMGRWLPFHGEVGWVLNGNPFVAWRGQLKTWNVVQNAALADARSGRAKKA